MEQFDEFDEQLKARARQEQFPLPEDYPGRVFATCAGLKETGAQRRRSSSRFFRRVGCGVAAALALFVALPNLSPTVAAAMVDVPVLGPLVEIVTFRNYTYDDGHSSADVAVPELGGSDAADQVNDQVQTYTDQLIARFKADCERIGEGYQGLDVSSTVVTDTDTWFTLRIDATETMASGYDFSRFYHIDKTTGQVVTLSDLFPVGSDYVDVLSAEVRSQMEARMAADESQMFFLDEFTSIDPEQNFYWNDSGELVLVFDEYAVAPGAMGMVEFPIPAAVTDSLR